jgi:hypothetical protein
MHGAHDDAVLEFGKTQVQGLEQMRVRVHAGVLGVLPKKQSRHAPGLRRTANKGGILYYAARALPVVISIAFK